MDNAHPENFGIVETKEYQPFFTKSLSRERGVFFFELDEERESFEMCQGLQVAPRFISPSSENINEI